MSSGTHCFKGGRSQPQWNRCILCLLKCGGYGGIEVGGDSDHFSKFPMFFE